MAILTTVIRRGFALYNYEYSISAIRILTIPQKQPSTAVSAPFHQNPGEATVRNTFCQTMKVLFGLFFAESHNAVAHCQQVGPHRDGQTVSQQWLQRPP